MEDNIPNKNLSKRAQMLQAASPYVSEEYRNYLDVIVGTEELQCNMRQISDRNNPFFKNRKKGESDLHTNAINTNPMGSLTNMFQGFDMIGLLGAIKDFFDDKERKMIEQILPPYD